MRLRSITETFVTMTRLAKLSIFSLPLAKWLASFAVAALAVNDMIDAIKQKNEKGYVFGGFSLSCSHGYLTT
ncbi:hypothetical protein OK016_18395 [Vibrio chagasii]|nr:hypothetical protein [Vibrio chagasii]